MKKCNSCGYNKELNAFVKDPRNKDGRKSYCIQCARDKSRAAGAKKLEERQKWAPI